MHEQKAKSRFIYDPFMIPWKTPNDPQVKNRWFKHTKTENNCVECNADLFQLCSLQPRKVIQGKEMKG